MKCECVWNGNEVKAFCGAHEELHRQTMAPVEHELKLIKDYAKNQHPLISSRACPLCTWDWELDEATGFGKGKFIKACGYHYAIDELRRIYTEDE